MTIGRILFVFFLLLTVLPCKSQERSLEYFLSEGIKNSPLIKDLKGQIQSNGIDSIILRAKNKPKAEFRAYAFYAPVVNNFGYSEILTNIANLTSVMSVSQPIFNKKILESNLAKTGIQGQSLTNTLHLTELSLKKAITAAYLDIWSTSSDIAVNRELHSFAEEQKNILRSLTENGIYKQTDFLSFMIGYQELELQARELNIQIHKQISELYILCGIRDTAIFTPVSPDLTTSSTAKQGRSPLFIRFYLDSLMISNEHLLVDLNYHPSISWFSDAGLINNDPKVIYQNFGLSVGLNFNLPVFDGNQRKLNHQKLKQEEDIRSGYAESFRREYSQQYRQLSDEKTQILALVPAVKAQVDNSRLLVNQEKELVSKGTGSITDYLIAVKSYLSVRKSFNSYQVRIMQIENEINFMKN